MTPNVTDIQAIVCAEFHIRRRDMSSDRLARAFSRPRQVAMYLSYEMTPLSTGAIARLFHRDHSTVIHACRTIEQIMQHDPAFAAVVERLRYRITYPDQDALPFAERAWRSYGA
jgi:chromosomal replication initiator protein